VVKTIKVQRLARDVEKSESSVVIGLEHGWTTELLAKASGVSTGYIRRLLRTEKLSGVRLNRDWFIGKAEGDRWLRCRGIRVE
jgi:hypothetical protein